MKTTHETTLKDPQLRRRLDDYYAQAEAIILARQDPISGLLPASTAVTVHGDYTDAWVRDNVYSILAVWGLALAYRGQGDDEGKAYRLEQSTVKLMRGLLTAMLKQSAKVERFKHTLDPVDALHAKYDTRSGDPVVGDLDWGHLQIDATALFLLMLAQMTASGLRIVFTPDEVDFVQNLVHYLGRAFHTPDYGIWERGHKMNEGEAELNASSLGMAKAALEALRGFDLFGVGGGPASTIHVPADDVALARTTLEALLPRESSSKEIDAALLSVIGYPAYAVEDPALAELTRAKIVGKLQGRYGCKRFLRDGHQTVLEDHDRLHYQTGELQRFHGIESEWPLFFTYLLLDGVLREDPEQARDYRERLENLMVDREGQRLLPELYYVPADKVEAERAAPGSQERLPNDNVPLVWAQSLYLLGALLQDGFIRAEDVDPLGRRGRIGRTRETRVQLALLAENAQVQAQLEGHGLAAQTPEQVALELRPSSVLTGLLSRLGENPRLGLSGRPQRRLGSLATSQVYTLDGRTVLFLPPFLDGHDFYLNLDNRLLAERIKTELAYVQRHWDQSGQPLMVLRVTEAMLQAGGHQVLLDLLRELQAGCCNGLKVHVGALAELLEQLGQSRNPYEQVELLGLLWERLGADFDTGSGTLRRQAEAVYEQAAEARLWGVVRRAAGLLVKTDPGLEDAVADVLVRQHQLSVGRAYSSEAVLGRPLGNAEIVERILAYGGDDPRGRVLIQEIVLYLGMLIKADPALFRGTLTLRAWHLLLLVTGSLAQERGLSEGEAFDALLDLSPNQLLGRLQQVVADDRKARHELAHLEALHHEGGIQGLNRVRFPATAGEPESDWYAWRERSGVLTRLPDDYYGRVWEILGHCRGLVIGDRLDSRNRLDSTAIRSDTTPGEKDFALRVEGLLNNIQAPEYRQLGIETVLALSVILRVNPSLRIEDDLVLDALIGHAVHLSWMEDHPELAEEVYNEQSAEAWRAFYNSPPHRVANAVADALSYLLASADPPAIAA